MRYRCINVWRKSRRYHSIKRALIKQLWSDRVKVVAQRLFPGYLFCRLDPRQRWLPVLTTPGVVSIVGTGKEPIAIPETEIETVRQIVRSTTSGEPWPYLHWIHAKK